MSRRRYRSPFDRPRRSGMPTPLSRRIVAGVNAQAGLTLDPELFFIRRLNPGSGDRSAGAWVWALEAISGTDRETARMGADIGSQWPATEVVKGFVIEVSQWGDRALVPVGA